MDTKDYYEEDYANYDDIPYDPEKAHEQD